MECFKGHRWDTQRSHWSQWDTQTNLRRPHALPQINSTKSLSLCLSNGFRNGGRSAVNFAALQGRPQNLGALPSPRKYNLRYDAILPGGQCVWAKTLAACRVHVPPPGSGPLPTRPPRRGFRAKLVETVCSRKYPCYFSGRVLCVAALLHTLHSCCTGCPWPRWPPEHPGVFEDGGSA